MVYSVLLLYLLALLPLVAEKVIVTEDPAQTGVVATFVTEMDWAFTSAKENTNPIAKIRNPLIDQDAASYFLNSFTNENGKTN